LRDAVKKLTVSPSQIASQISGAGSHSVSPSDASFAAAIKGKTIENKGEKSLAGAAWRVLSKIQEWCAVEVSNLRPPPCQGDALPLS
jgi:hypothetical protein